MSDRHRNEHEQQSDPDLSAEARDYLRQKYLQAGRYLTERDEYRHRLETD